MPVSFVTPTLLNVKAITTFGINAKPNSTSPIGFFGTGLKYAIAVLIREDHQLEMSIGKDIITFYGDTQEFRDKQFKFIYMNYYNAEKNRSKKIQLPFTTELGKTWELWQAFRELYSNTIDENGTCIEDSFVNLSTDTNTVITIVGEPFYDIFKDKDSVFLADGLKDFTNDIIQILDRPSERLYYRSMRALDLSHESKFTYNILTSLSLTEDRTIKFSWEADRIIAHYIAVNCTDEQLIEAVLSCEDDTYEGRLNFEDVYATSSGHFSRVYHKLGKDLKNKSARGYYSNYGYGRIVPEDNRTWQQRLIECLNKGVYSKAWDILELHKDEIIRLLSGEFVRVDSKENLVYINDNQLCLFKD